MNSLYSVLIVQCQEDYNQFKATDLIYLELAKYSIGRHTDRDIVLLDRHVSRYHSTLVLLPSSPEEELPYYTIQDGDLLGKNSVNGTWLNGFRIQSPTKLNNEDVITFCQGYEYPRITFFIQPNLEDYESGTIPEEFQSN